MADVVIINSEQEWKNATTSGVAIVDFTATWCGPCKMIGPIFEQLASEFKGKLTFLKVDVDSNAEVAANAGIKAMPTFQVYKDGVKVEEFCGAQKDNLRALVEKYAA